jgi:poly(hydroxyalkanoate) depolymerase family esterase
MNLKIPESLLHATRLLRSGKLMEATDAIQRALRGGSAASGTYAYDPAMAEAEAIPGYARVVEREPTRLAHGQFVSRSHTNAAGTCEYRLYIPGRGERGALPLVVMLHGCKQDPDTFAAATRMNLLAEEHGFLVAYPKQAGNANASHCWNWFEPKHQQRDRGEPSLIAGITRDVIAAHGADARRVYVAGLSAGGAMAAVMGTTYPDVYAAVGIHSGLAYAAARDVPSAFAAMRGPGSKPPKRKSRAAAAAIAHLPMIVFHGDGDKTVHPSNGDDLIAQASRAASGAGSREAYSEHERSVEHGAASGREYTRTTYRDVAGKPVMEQWLIHGGAHAWSGGSADGSYTDPAGPDASREMLRFFLLHRNP